MLITSSALLNAHHPIIPSPRPPPLCILEFSISYGLPPLNFHLFIFPSLPLCSSDVSLFFFTKGGGYTCWPLVISRAASRLGWNLEWGWGSPNTTSLRALRPCLLPPPAPSTPFTCGSPSKRGQAPSPHRGDGSWGRAPSWLHNLLPLPPHLPPSLFPDLLPSISAQDSQMLFHGDFWIWTPDHRPPDTPAPTLLILCLWHVRVAVGKSDHSPAPLG